MNSDLCGMQVFREPVITPSGCSYERSALLEHLSKVGKFDPITRQPMSESDVTLNVGLRNATQQYLDEHPWAWGEVV
jgi:STIP1 family protein 1